MNEHCSICGATWLKHYLEIEGTCAELTAARAVVEAAEKSYRQIHYEFHDKLRCSLDDYYVVKAKAAARKEKE